MKNFEIVWVATGVALTSATQLRPAGFPVGPGEVMVCAWILLVAARISILRHHLITPLTRAVILFWTISFTALALGLLIAESLTLTSSFYHDLLAFLLVFVFSIAFSISVFSKKDSRKLLAVFLSFTMLSLVVTFFIPSLLPFLSPWYLAERFQGWSDNPNQMGLLATPIPFLCLHLAVYSKYQKEKIWYGLLILGAFIIGVSTQSDSLRVGWILAILVIVSLGPYRSISSYSDKHLLASKAFALKQLSLLSLLFITFLMGLVFQEKIGKIVHKVYNYGSQGDTRFQLWGNGIAAFLNSPFFGLGPGAHSGTTEPLFHIEEAHNTFIDWTASSGLIGLICYVALLVWVVWNAWKNGSIFLVAAIVSLVVFTIFGYMLRHIIFWFYLLVITSLSTPSVSPQPLPVSISAYFEKNKTEL